MAIETKHAIEMATDFSASSLKEIAEAAKHRARLIKDNLELADIRGPSIAYRLMDDLQQMAHYIDDILEIQKL